MKDAFEINRQTRKNILYYLDGLNEDSINKIPDGFGNNIAWNLGHILVSQQLLEYGLSNLEVRIPKEWISKYRKGSKPESRVSMEEFEQIKSLFISTIDWAEKDYKAGEFSTFSPYKTSYGFALSKIEDVLSFIYAHDAFHWGVIASLKKVVL